MVKKENRLPVQGFVKQRSYPSPFFTLLMASSPSVKPRVGFLVTKRIDKRAVVRNRVKRQVRSCVEKLLPQIHSGNDLLFALKKDAVGKETALLCNAVEGALKKMHAYSSSKPSQTRRIEKFSTSSNNKAFT